MKLPSHIYTAAQVRALDRRAIDELGIPGITLMNRAGAAAIEALRERWPAAKCIAVVCGFGNNAGDGYVVARLARAQHLDVIVIALGDPAALRGDALTAYQEFARDGGTVSRPIAPQVPAVDVIVDAIFGTGLNRIVDNEVGAWIRAINQASASNQATTTEHGNAGKLAGAATPARASGQSNTPVFCLDIPSGLDATSGHILGVAVEGDCTITFVGLKSGFYLGEGPNYTGTLLFDDLQIPAPTDEHIAERLTPQLIADVLPRRPRTSNKGLNGHVLIIGGGPGMPGAARLAGEAALRAGAGLVSVATHPQNLTAIAAGRPELICHGVNNAKDLAIHLQRATVIAVGPGLGQDAWAVEMFDAALTANKPLVVDADALNLLAQRFSQQPPRNAAEQPDLHLPAAHRPAAHRRADWILTPHPGEAARLLGTTVPQIQDDRLVASRKLVERYGGFVVLKGAGSIIACEGKVPAICDRGNPGMAVAGMGDVLTGIVTAIAAQSKNLWDAARAGVLVHAMAGDLAAQHGERGLLASDLFPHLAQCVNP